MKTNFYFCQFGKIVDNLFNKEKIIIINKVTNKQTNKQNIKENKIKLLLRNLNNLLKLHKIKRKQKHRKWKKPTELKSKNKRFIKTNKQTKQNY